MRLKNGHQGAKFKPESTTCCTDNDSYFLHHWQTSATHSISFSFTWRKFLTGTHIISTFLSKPNSYLCQTTTHIFTAQRKYKEKKDNRELNACIHITYLIYFFTFISKCLHNDTETSYTTKCVSMLSWILNRSI